MVDTVIVEAETPAVSAVSWPAIIAGGFVAAAFTLLLLALGAGIGFSVISPWSGLPDITTTKAALVGGIYMAVTTVMASALGGYVTGRLRVRWTRAPLDEVYFRDTAHGVLAWAFATVMGAQVIISAINTVLTAVFVLVMHLPYGIVVIGVTFLCGLVPVVGNLVSNIIIVGIGITVSPKAALVALIFLVVVHKLEYFLNSKIIGDRIKNPVWLTLLALILGERLMGIPGMILAPVILNYIKVETATLPANGPNTG